MNFLLIPLFTLAVQVQSSPYPWHDEYHDMYKQYQQPNGTTDCCKQDCSPATVRYSEEYGLEFLWTYDDKDMGWFPVPESQIIPSFDHQFHICAYRSGDEPVVRCAFVPGSV